MRLIDADALKRKLTAFVDKDDDPYMFIEDAFFALDNAPTVQKIEGDA